MSKLYERCSGSVPEPLGKLELTSRRAPRSLSSIGADRTASFLFTRFCFASLLVGGLHGCATYQSEPLEPAKVAQQFDSRSLSNLKLCQYLKANPDSNLSSCPPPQWSLAALTLVGFYYSPDVAVADARVRETDAAVITARAVPNPTSI